MGKLPLSPTFHLHRPPPPAPSPIRPDNWALPSAAGRGWPGEGQCPRCSAWGRASSPTVVVGGGEVGVRIRAGRRFEPKTDWWELVLDSWQRKRGTARACDFFFSFMRCELKQLKICILFYTTCLAVSLHLCFSPRPIRMVGISQQLFIFQVIRQIACVPKFS